MQKGNAICATTAQQIKTGAAAVFPNPVQAGMQDAGQVETYAKTVVLPELQKEYEQLRALKPTSDTDPRVTLSELERSIDKWEVDKTRMAEVNDTSFASFDALATDFGLTTCAATDGMIRSITSGEPLPT